MSHISQERLSLSFSLQQLCKFANFQHRNFGDERAQTVQKMGMPDAGFMTPELCTSLEGVALGQPL